MTGPWQLAFVALATLVLVLGVVVLGLLRRVGAALDRVEQLYDVGSPVLGLRAGARVSAFEVSGSDGSRRVLPSDGPGEVFLVLLVGMDCEACTVLLDQLRREQWRAAVPLLVVLPESDRPAAPTLSASGVHVVFQEGTAASRAFETNVTPIVYALTSRGVVVERLIPSDVQSLRDLAAEAVPSGLPPATHHDSHEKGHQHVR